MNQISPVREGEELDVVIEAVGEKGDGIARKDGFVLFVAGTKQGDEVRIRVTKVLQKAGFAEVVGKIEKPPSQDELKAKENEKLLDESKDSEDFGEDMD